MACRCLLAVGMRRPIDPRASASEPSEAVCAKRLVLEAVVEKKLVVVPFRAVKFWSVVEALTRSCWKLDGVAVEVAVRYGMVMAPESVCAPETVRLPVRTRSPESVPPASGR